MAYRITTRPDEELRRIHARRRRWGSLGLGVLLVLALLIGGVAAVAADARLAAGRLEGAGGTAVALARPQGNATASATRAGVIIIPPDTATPTVTPTATRTPGGSAPAETPTAPAVATVSLVTDTPTPAATSTVPPSATPTATLTDTPTASPTATEAPSATPTLTVTLALTPTLDVTLPTDALPSILTPVAPVVTATVAATVTATVTAAVTTTETATATATVAVSVPVTVTPTGETPTGEIPPSILTPVTPPPVATVSLVTDTPTPTPVVQVPTNTPTMTPTPTATFTFTPSPTATNLPTLVITATNLYSGPGIQFAVVASVQRGDVVVVVGQTLERDWYLLDTGAWIQAAMVGNAPVDPVVVTPEAPALSAAVVSGGGVAGGGAYALRNANLRGGPGTEYPILGHVKAGDPLTIVNQSPAGDWYQLDNGCWIAAFLVGNAPPGQVAGEPIAPVAGGTTSVAGGTASVTGGAAVVVEPAQEFYAVVFSAANLYTGPGVQYPIATRVQQGQLVRLVAQTFDGNWYLLDNGYWIASFLVDIVPPEGVLIAPIAPPTLPPPRAIEIPVVAPTPTFTPVAATVGPELTPVEQAYVADVRAVLDGYATALAQIETQMTSANESPVLILDSEWLIRSGAAIDLLDAQNLAARALVAPPRYTSVQAELLTAAGHLEEAALLLTRAVEELDPLLVPQAIAALDAGKTALNRVEALLPVVAAQSPSIPTPVPTPAAEATQTLQPSPQTCDPSYPDVCIPPPPPVLACTEIPFRNFRVTGADPHGYDSDGNGLGCETG